MKSTTLLTIILLPFALEQLGCPAGPEITATRFIPRDDAPNETSGSAGGGGPATSGAGGRRAPGRSGDALGMAGDGGAGNGAADGGGGAGNGAADGGGGAGGGIPSGNGLPDGGVAGNGAADAGFSLCGNGVVEGSEPCDDGNAVETDACLTGCVSASCGDGFVHAGVEQCDDGDGCTPACTFAPIGHFGPWHDFNGLSSDFYITQGGCSNSGGEPAGDALYFCQHFDGPECTAVPGYDEASLIEGIMMHSGENCVSPDPAGVSIPNTICFGGPCKIGDYSGVVTGLSGIICDCP